MTLHFYISKTLGLHGSGVLVFSGKVHSSDGPFGTVGKCLHLF